MRSKRRIVYFSGTRADFGLMENTLHKIHNSRFLELAIVVTGMHLDPAYGHTIDDIVATGLPIAAKVEIDHGPADGGRMAQNIGRMIVGFVNALVELEPDQVLLLGDRGEMLAAAISAIHLNIPIVHIHGGERSGTIDEPVRHAISKLSHFHLVATQNSRERLVQMGECPERVVIVGAPGLDNLQELSAVTKNELFNRYQLDPKHRLVVLVYHPVVQEADAGAEITKAIVDALQVDGLQILALKPNSDAGSVEILQTLESASEDGRIRLVTHLRRHDYVSFLRYADVLIGNSSSGIIEAATFGTPVINIGSRQNLRERNDNVIDVPAETVAIADALKHALAVGRFPLRNKYGDGHAADRIVCALEQMDLNSSSLMAKTNAY